jgi:SAM-dependent methyltransferase/ketosteroid isomerase-like protein
MRHAHLLLFLAGCATTPTLQAGPSAAAQLDEDQLKARSHAFLAAVDRYDRPAFAAAVGPAFTCFRKTRFYGAAFLGDGLTAAAGRHAPPRSRAFTEERAFLGGEVAVFVGASHLHTPAEEGAPAADGDGWDTLVWARDGGGWKVAHWQWQQGGLEAERDAWNEVYRQATGFEHRPNRLLVEAVRGVRPGAALDVATGEGRNALFLAAQGWRVTGVDVSDVGLRMARRRAEAERLPLETVEADIDTWDFGRERWDLVTLIYAGNDERQVERCKASLKPGGLLVVEFFLKDATAGTGIGGFGRGELARLVGDSFVILRDEVVEDVADWGLRRVPLVRFVARKR